MSKNIRHLSLALSLVFALTAVSAFAEETTGEKMDSSVRDAKAGTKKTMRKGKKKVRDATGNGSVKEDMKDAAKNTGDSLENTAKDVKNKVD